MTSAIEDSPTRRGFPERGRLDLGPDVPLTDFSYAAGLRLALIRDIVTREVCGSKLHALRRANKIVEVLAAARSANSGQIGSFAG